MFPQRGQHNTPSRNSVFGSIFPDSSKELSHHLHIYVIFLSSLQEIARFVLYFLFMSGKEPKFPDDRAKKKNCSEKKTGEDTQVRYPYIKKSVQANSTELIGCFRHGTIPVNDFLPDVTGGSR